MNRPESQARDDIAGAAGLAAWDGEGGALAIAAPTNGDAATALSTEERRLLARLGAALLGEWNNLPMPVRRAIYERAVRGAAASDPTALKRRMARFLHDRQGLRQLGVRT